MEHYTRNWLIVFGIAIALILWLLYQQHETITSIKSGMKEAVEKVQDFLVKLKAELVAIEEKLKEDAAQLYSAFKSAIDAAKSRIDVLIQKAKALAQRASEQIKEDIASARQSIKDEIAHLKEMASALGQKAEDEIKALEAGLKSHEAAVKAAYDKLKQEVGAVVSFIMEQIVPFLCNNTQLTSFLATGQFSIIDVASCKLKPVSGSCPRGTYGDTCQYLMCSGGDSSGTYDWQTADKWCSNNFATQSSDSTCESSSGLCVPSPLPVITGS